MRNARATVALLLVLLATGCSTPGPRSLQSGAFRANSTDIKAMTDDQVKELNRLIQDDFDRAFQACVVAKERYSGELDGASRKELYIAAVGIIAGSIIVPALAAKASAAKSAVAAWGGIAGAANAGQYVLNQKGMSAAAYASVYNTMRREVTEAWQAYENTTDVNLRRAAIVKLRVACEFPSLPTISPPTAPGNG